MSTCKCQKPTPNGITECCACRYGDDAAEDRSQEPTVIHHEQPAGPGDDDADHCRCKRDYTPQGYEFDWAELEARLGEAKTELPALDYKTAAGHLLKLLDWIIDGDLRGKTSSDRIARRTVAAICIIDPSRIDQSGHSIADLAKHLGIHKVMLSVHTAEFSKRFGINNPTQQAHA